MVYVCLNSVKMCELDREMLPNNDDHDVQVKLMSPDGSKTIDTWNCVLDKDKMETEYTSNFKAGKLFRSVNFSTDLIYKTLMNQCLDPRSTVILKVIAIEVLFPSNRFIDCA